MQSEPMSTENPPKHSHHRWHYLALGTALTAGAVMLAPHLLPALHLGDPTALGDIMEGIGSASTGLAGGVNNALASLPLIGASLAQGGWWTAGASVITGVGGLLLSHYVSRHEDGSNHIRWSRVIRTAALITSCLIALPMALTSVTIGLTYLASALMPDIAQQTFTFLSGTLGAVGAGHSALGGLSALVPHLLTCGTMLLPASLGWITGKKPHSHESSPAPQNDSMPGFRAALTLADPLIPGQPARAQLILTHADGSPLRNEELAVTHTEKMHLFVVDQSLKDYQHVHPQPTGVPGVYDFTFTPASSGHYSAWTDFSLTADGVPQRMKVEMPTPVGWNITPRIKGNNHAEQEGLQLDWSSSIPLRQNEPAIVEVTVRDLKGNPVTDLQPVMGERAHLSGFGDDGNSFIHAHPMASSEPSRLRFHVQPAVAGNAQFFVQLRRADKDMYVPFGQQVLPPALWSERGYDAAPSMAMAH